MMCCLLCYADLETHAHLFFDCSCSLKIWLLVRERACMSSVSSSWPEVISWLNNRASSKSIGNLVCRLIVAASVYCIWRERNARFFNNHARPPEVLGAEILDMVRLKLLGLKFKRKPNVMNTLEKWNIYEPNVSDDGG
jgi:hypothetical protein